MSTTSCVSNTSDSDSLNTEGQIYNLAMDSLQCVPSTSSRKKAKHMLPARVPPTSPPLKNVSCDNIATAAVTPSSGNVSGTLLSTESGTCDQSNALFTGSTNGVHSRTRSQASVITPRRSLAQSSIGSGTCDQSNASFTGSMNGLPLCTSSQTSVVIKSSKNICGTQEKLCILRGNDSTSSATAIEMASASISSTGDAKESSSVNEDYKIQTSRDNVINTMIAVPKHSSKTNEFKGSHLLSDSQTKEAADTSAFVPVKIILSVMDINVDDSTDVKEQVGLADDDSLSFANVVDEVEEYNKISSKSIKDKTDVKHGNHHDVILDPRQNFDVTMAEKNEVSAATFMEPMKKSGPHKNHFRYLDIAESCELLQCFINAWKTKRCFISAQKNRKCKNGKRLVPCNYDCYRFTCSLIHYLVCRMILGAEPLHISILARFKTLDAILSVTDPVETPNANLSATDAAERQKRNLYKLIIAEVYSTVFAKNPNEGRMVQIMMSEKSQFSKCCHFVNRRVILMKKGTWSDPNMKEQVCNCEWTVYRKFLEYLGIFPAQATSSERQQGLLSFKSDKFMRQVPAAPTQPPGTKNNKESNHLASPPKVHRKTKMEATDGVMVEGTSVACFLKKLYAANVAVSLDKAVGDKVSALHHKCKKPSTTSLPCKKRAITILRDEASQIYQQSRASQGNDLAQDLLTEHCCSLLQSIKDTEQDLKDEDDEIEVLSNP